MMTEKETLLTIGGVFAAWLLLRKKTPSVPKVNASSAQAQAAAQLAAAQAQAAARGGASGAGELAAGIGAGLGSLLKGISSLSGAGSGTNKENGGNYSTENAQVVDEYANTPETMYDNAGTAADSSAWAGAASGGTPDDSGGY